MLQCSTQWRNAENPVFLTFDDGPFGSLTSSILDTLARYNIKAAFFVVGRNLEKSENKALIKRMRLEGHRIGNHSYSHPNLTNLSQQNIYSEIHRTQLVISECGGTSALFRPPFGLVDEKVLSTVRDMNLWGLGWSVDTFDWRDESDPRAWMERGLAPLTKSRQNILLLHDVQARTAENLEVFVQELIKRNHTFPPLFAEDDLSINEDQTWIQVRPSWSMLQGLPLFRPSSSSVQDVSRTAQNSRGRTSGKTPIVLQPKQKWENEYSAHLWDCLRNEEERPRYSVVLGFCMFACRNKRVLDAGCGNAILLDYLKSCGYENYLGIDISEAAIKDNQVKADDRTRFIAANIEEYIPPGKFDCIVFNECLYYLSDPLAVLQKYRAVLAKDGIMIVSMFISNRRIANLFSRLRRKYACISSVVLKNQRGRWICGLFANTEVRQMLKDSSIQLSANGGQANKPFQPAIG